MNAHAPTQLSSFYLCLSPALPPASLAHLCTACGDWWALGMRAFALMPPLPLQAV